MKAVGKLIGKITVIKTLMFLVVLCFSRCTEERIGPLSGAFLKYYGDTGLDELNIAEETSTGEFILLGSSKKDTVESVAKQMYVVKTNENGIKLRENIFGGTNTTSGNALKETPDGDFVLIGDHIDTLGNSDLYIVKTDKDLNKKWETVIPILGSDEHASALTLLPNGNCFVLGTSSTPDGSDEMITILVSEDGQLMQTPGRPGLESKNDHVGKSVVLRANGRLAWSGTIYRDIAGNDPGTSNIRMIFATEDGISDGGDFDYGRKRNDYAADIQNASTGFILLGTTDGISNEGSKIYLVKTDESGTQQWAKVIGSTGGNIGGNQRGSSVYPTNDGGYIILGATDISNFKNQDGQNLYLVKTDVNGKVEWEEIYGGSGNDVPSTVRQTNDGGYLIAATIELNGNSTMCLIKTNSRGEILN